MHIMKTAICREHEIPSWLTPDALKNGPLPNLSESYQATFLEVISNYAPLFIGFISWELNAVGEPLGSGPVHGTYFIFPSGINFFLQRTPERQIWTFREKPLFTTTTESDAIPAPVDLLTDLRQRYDALSENDKVTFIRNLLNSGK